MIHIVCRLNVCGSYIFGSRYVFRFHIEAWCFSMQFPFLSVFLEMAGLMMVINVQHDQLQGILII